MPQGMTKGSDFSLFKKKPARGLCCGLNQLDTEKTLHLSVYHEEDLGCRCNHKQLSLTVTKGICTPEGCGSKAILEEALVLNSVCHPEKGTFQKSEGKRWI